MLNKSLLIASLSVIMLAGCSAMSSNDLDSEWRLRSTRQERLDDTLLVYSACYRGKPTEFIQSRDFEPGEHTIIAKLSQTFEPLKSKPRQTYVTLNGTFSQGEIYNFAVDVSGNDATIYIVNSETDEAVTNKVKTRLDVLTLPELESRNRQRCKASTI